MTFQPVVPFGGNAGWAFLQRTQEAQKEAFNQSPLIERETQYFVENISTIQNAEELVNDRRLLSVALGAFGLDDDINNKFFIQKVLSDGTIDPDSLANRLSDKRYLALSEAFGFGDVSPPRSVISTFGLAIAESFRERRFEAAIGDQSQSLRLALSLERELEQVTSRNLSEDGQWFTIMATPPLRAVFETAFALPSSLGALDIDQQLSVFKDRADRFFGEETVAQFSDPEKQQELLRLFLARSDLQVSPATTTRGSVALAILQSGSSGQTGLLL